MGSLEVGRKGGGMFVSESCSLKSCVCVGCSSKRVLLGKKGLGQGQQLISALHGPGTEGGQSSGSCPTDK